MGLPCLESNIFLFKFELMCVSFFLHLITFFIYLRDIKKDKTIELHVLVHSNNVCNGPSRTRWSWKMATTPTSSLWVAETQLLNHHLLSPRVYIVRTLYKETGLGVEPGATIRDTGIPRKILINCCTRHPSHTPKHTHNFVFMCICIYFCMGITELY